MQLYLLQLVQALKYEDFDEICAGLDPRSLMLSVRSFNSADSFPSPEKPAGYDLSADDRYIYMLVDVFLFFMCSSVC